MNSSDTSHLRPINPLRDIDCLTNLIELEFGHEMERWGGNFRAQMRMAKVMAPWFKFLGFFSNNYRHTFDGYIWDEGGICIAAVILQPVLYDFTRWQIMNVVTHPDYRRRGIARLLVSKAIEHAQLNGAQTCYLEVQETAEPAIRLYEQLGFRIYDHLTILKRTGNDSIIGQRVDDYRISQMSMGDWMKRFELAKHIIPDEIQDFFPISRGEYQFSIWQQVFDPVIMRLQGIESSWWGVEHGSSLVGFANLVSCKSPLMSNRIEIEILPEHRGSVVDNLLDMLLGRLQNHPQQVTMTTINTNAHNIMQAYVDRKFEIMEVFLRMGLRI